MPDTDGFSVEYDPINAHAAASPRAAPQPAQDEIDASIDPVIWHTLSSILPLLQLLPAFNDDSGQYILSGPITASDVAFVNAHAKLVKTFNIFGCGPKSPSLNISPSVYTQIFRYFREPFLPSLEKLTINIPSNCMYPSMNRDIWEVELVFSVLLSQSIREVELCGINHISERAVLSLLASLPHDAPRCKKLVFKDVDQYKLPLTVTKSLISEMTSLEHLEIDDVVNITDFDILRKIGALPNLVTFVLHNSTLDYCSESNRNTTASRAVGFMKLGHLDVTASFELISDLLHYVGSPSLKLLEFSPVVGVQHDVFGAFIVKAGVKTDRAKPSVKINGATAGCAKTKVPPEIEDVDDPWGLPVKRMRKDLKSGTIDDKQQKEMAEGGKPVSKSSRSSVDHPPLEVIHSLDTSSPWVKALEEMLQHIPMRWRSLESLTIRLSDTTKSDRIFELPGRYLNPLRLLADLHTFHIEQWRILDCYATILRLAPSLSKIRNLGLPLGKFSSPVDLRVLQTFADSFPELEYLQIPLLIPDDVSTHNLDASPGAAVHPLSTLYAGLTSSPMTFTEMMDVAGLIDALFPGLKKISTYQEQGAFCTEIAELVKFAQSARRKERIRINGGPTD
ncbi:hypothetical protein BDQ17DRAFT_1358778 [Cyathus striatus]|nr:hypothetical protein BDQ17DRAFT_1358778 [Cyathus striatus]